MSQRRSQRQSQSERSFSSQIQTQTQTQTQTQVTEEAIEEASVDIVDFLLDCQRFGHPVKRQIITKNVPKSQGRIFKTVMESAKKKLDDIFGIDLIELGSKNNLRYMMVNKLKSTDPEINQQIANNSILKKIEKQLLLLTLTVIHKSGGELKESSLLDFYRRVRIIDNVEKPTVITPHFAGIEILKFLRNDLVDTQYLESNVVDEDGENEMRFFSWGMRAESEVDLNEMEDYYQSIMQINRL